LTAILVQAFKELVQDNNALRQRVDVLEHAVETGGPAAVPG
jgi:hypothetical protein